MADHSEIPTADAVETLVASLSLRSAPVNTIKSYAHDLRLFVQAVPADLSTGTKNDAKELDQRRQIGQASVMLLEPLRWLCIVCE